MGNTCSHHRTKSTPSIFDLIRKEKWDKILNLCNERPDKAAALDKYGRTPLHEACIQFTPIDVIFELLLCHPSAAAFQDVHGRTPLHVISCSSWASSDVVRLFVNAHPNAAIMRDEQGRTPLCVIVGGCASNASVLSLLHACPKATQIQTRSGKTPLHVACMDTWGAWRAPRSLSVIKALVDEFPRAAALPDCGGKTPLHYACLYGASFEIIKLLVETCPRALHKADCRGRLPLHAVCCGLGGDPDPLTIGFLVRMHPGAMRLLDGHGRTPLGIIEEQMSGAYAWRCDDCWRKDDYYWRVVDSFVKTEYYGTADDILHDGTPTSTVRACLNAKGCPVSLIQRAIATFPDEVPEALLGLNVDERVFPFLLSDRSVLKGWRLSTMFELLRGMPHLVDSVSTRSGKEMK